MFPMFRNCGAISLGLSENCMNCGADLENISDNNQFDKQKLRCFNFFFI